MSLPCGVNCLLVGAKPGWRASIGVRRNGEKSSDRSSGRIEGGVAGRLMVFLPDLVIVRRYDGDKGSFIEDDEDIKPESRDSNAGPTFEQVGDLYVIKRRSCCRLGLGVFGCWWSSAVRGNVSCHSLTALTGLDSGARAWTWQGLALSRVELDMSLQDGPVLGSANAICFRPSSGEDLVLFWPSAAACGRLRSGSILWSWRKLRAGVWEELDIWDRSELGPISCRPFRSSKGKRLRLFCSFLIPTILRCLGVGMLSHSSAFNANAAKPASDSSIWGPADRGRIGRVPVAAGSAFALVSFEPFSLAASIRSTTVSSEYPPSLSHRSIFHAGPSLDWSYALGWAETIGEATSAKVGSLFFPFVAFFSTAESQLAARSFRWRSFPPPY